MGLGAANRKVGLINQVGFDAEGSVIRTQGIAPAEPYLNEMVAKTNKGGTAKLSLSPLLGERLYIFGKLTKEAMK
jgi:hypothetical protein